MLASWSPAEWADVIRAATALLWPVLIGSIVWVFHQPLRALIGRNCEFELPGFKAKFDADPGAVQAVKRQLDIGPDDEDVVAPPGGEPAEGEPAAQATPSLYDDIADLATRDVRVALLRLFDALEARIRDLASAWGGLDPHTPK